MASEPAEAPDTWACCPVEVKVDVGAAKPGTFSGYASVFGIKDGNKDMIMSGAFKRTLTESTAAKRMPRMFVNHAGFATGTVTANDLIPIGVWDVMGEDTKGLNVAGRLIALDTDRGKAIYAAMLEGVLSDMSIGYKAEVFTLATKATDPRRTITDLTLFEISPVFHPANPEARIVTVASLMGDADPTNIRFLEGLLCDAGLTRREAKALLAEGHKAIRSQRDAGESESFDRLLATLRDTSSSFSS